MEETIKAGDAFYVVSTKNFKRNDIVVFNYWGEDYSRPLDEPGKFEMSWQKWAKRLIAVSGDSLKIINADVIINGKVADAPPLSVMEYDVFATEYIDDFPLRNEWDNNMIGKIGDTFHYVGHLTAEQAAAYKKRKPVVTKVQKRLAVYNNSDTSLAKSCSSCEWTIDNYGPLKIPSPGDTVTVTPENFRLYHNIPGIQYGKNVIKETLYFVMGDNRHASQDSRFIGYISHSKMYGIVK